MHLTLPEFYFYGLIVAAMLGPRALGEYTRSAFAVVVTEVPDDWWLRPWMRPFAELMVFVGLANILVRGVRRRLPALIAWTRRDRHKFVKRPRASLSDPPQRAS